MDRHGVISVGELVDFLDKLNYHADVFIDEESQSICVVTKDSNGHIQAETINAPRVYHKGD